MTIPEWLMAAKDRDHLNVNEAGALFDRTGTTFSQWASGKRLVPHEKRRALADWTGVDYETFREEWDRDKAARDARGGLTSAQGGEIAEALRTLVVELQGVAQSMRVALDQRAAPPKSGSQTRRHAAR
jgi:hypothetical protein